MGISLPAEAPGLERTITAGQKKIASGSRNSRVVKTPGPLWGGGVGEWVW